MHIYVYHVRSMSDIPVHSISQNHVITQTHFFLLHDVIFTKSTKQCTNSLAHLITYYFTFLAAKRTIFTLKVHSCNCNEVKHVKAYNIRYDEIWKVIILVKKWVNVFHTCNYIAVTKYEVWLHLRNIYANTDEIGIHKTKKIKTFQSKNTKFLKITVFQHIILLFFTILSYTNSTETMHKIF